MFGIHVTEKVSNQ